MFRGKYKIMIKCVKTDCPRTFAIFANVGNQVIAGFVHLTFYLNYLNVRC